MASMLVSIDSKLVATPTRHNTISHNPEVPRREYIRNIFCSQYRNRFSLSSQKIKTAKEVNRIEKVEEECDLK